jgi:hypothetical protein
MMPFEKKPKKDDQYGSEKDVKAHPTSVINYYFPGPSHSISLTKKIHGSCMFLGTVVKVMQTPPPCVLSVSYM